MQKKLLTGLLLSAISLSNACFGVMENLNQHEWEIAGYQGGASYSCHKPKEGETMILDIAVTRPNATPAQPICHTHDENGCQKHTPIIGPINNSDRVYLEAYQRIVSAHSKNHPRIISSTYRENSLILRSPS